MPTTHSRWGDDEDDEDVEINEDDDGEVCSYHGRYNRPERQCPECEYEYACDQAYSEWKDEGKEGPMPTVRRSGYHRG